MNVANHVTQLKIVAAYGALTLRKDKWIGAIEAAEVVADRLAEVGIPWPWSYRPVAFALRRLVKAGLVQERDVFYRSRHKARECRREYRLCAPLEPPPMTPMSVWFPQALPVTANAPRRVIQPMGKLERWDKYDATETCEE